MDNTNTTTSVFEKGYDFLKYCPKIEEWVCEFKDGIKKNTVNQVVISMSTPNVSSSGNTSDTITDFVNYKSNVDGICMLHVLENNDEWKQILHNALQSFTEKMCIVLSSNTDTKTSLDTKDITDILKLYHIDYNIETVSNENTNDCKIIYLNKQYLAFYTYFYGTDANMYFDMCFPQIPSKNYKCYYYTNNQSVYDKLKETNSWTVIFDDTHNLNIHDDTIDSNMAGKYIKTQPFEYSELQKYKYICYLDSTIEFYNQVSSYCNYLNCIGEPISETLVEDFIYTGFVKNNKIIMVKESWFITRNIWVEVDYSRRNARYNRDIDKYNNYIHTQLETGLTPIHFPNSACGFMIRNMRHPKCIEFCKMWYDQILECGIQDQISFYFVQQHFEGYVQHFDNSPFRVKS